MRSTTGFATPAMKVRRRTVSEQSSANDEDEDEEDSENTVSLFPYLCFFSPYFCPLCEVLLWADDVLGPIDWLSRPAFPSSHF